MSKYQFAISSGPEPIRQAGVVETNFFDEAVNLPGDRITVQGGDHLAIGVIGFPPRATTAAAPSAVGRLGFLRGDSPHSAARWN